MRLVLEKRNERSSKMTLLVPIVSLLVSFLLGAIVLRISGARPLDAYAAMIRGAFGSKTKFQYTVREAIPILICGLGVGIAFKMKFWNIGAEGQYVFGAIGITWVMQFWTGVPHSLLLPVGLVMSILFGAFWGGIPGVLKAQWKVDENLTTLMMNYIAIGIAEWLYINKWKAPRGNMGTVMYPPYGWLPSLWGKISYGLIYALILVFVMYFIMYKTQWGFELNMIGKNPFAAQCQGVSLKKNMIIVMLISGGIAGFAGGLQSAGVMHQLTKGIDNGYGFTGIIIAWMGGLNPFGSILVSLLIAALKTGSDALKIMNLSASIGDVLQGLILLPLLGGSIFTDYRLRCIRTKEKEATA